MWDGIDIGLNGVIICCICENARPERQTIFHSRFYLLDYLWRVKFNDILLGRVFNLCVEKLMGVGKVIKVWGSKYFRRISRYGGAQQRSGSRNSRLFFSFC